jgi:hypothetical protein
MEKGNEKGKGDEKEKGEINFSDNSFSPGGKDA